MLVPQFKFLCSLSSWGVEAYVNSYIVSLRVFVVSLTSPFAKAECKLQNRRREKQTFDDL